MDVSRSGQQEALSLLVRAGDVIFIFAAAQAVFASTGTVMDSTGPFILVQYLSCVLGCFLLPHGDLHDPMERGARLAVFRSLVAGWTLTMLIVMAIAMPMLATNLGEVTKLGHLYFAGAIALIVWRVCFMSAIDYLHRLGIRVKRVLLVGQSDVPQLMRAHTSYQAWQRYDIVAMYRGTDHANPASNSPRVHQLQALDDIHNYLQDNNIHEVWISVPMITPHYLPPLYHSLQNALVDVKLIPESFNMRTLSSAVVNLPGCTALDLNRPGICGVNALVKDLFDRLFAATVLLLLSPLLLGIAIAVARSSPGPVLFRQKRLGLNGKPFDVYKFRSMVVHAEADALIQASTDDWRTTRVGKFLRRTSLDELPQFFNVLLGDMSVVGPRPHALKHNELYKHRLDVYMLRHRVKPGITGWAQINGLRGETDTDEKMERRVQFDLHYIRNWSLWLDVKIVAWTALRGWSGANAY